MGFSRQEYWSGLPFPSPGDLPDPGIEPGSLTLQEDTLTSEPPGKPLNSAVVTVLEKVSLYSNPPKKEMPNNAARLQHYENRKLQIYMLGLDSKRDTDV